MSDLFHTLQAASVWAGDQLTSPSGGFCTVIDARWIDCWRVLTYMDSGTLQQQVCGPDAPKLVRKHQYEYRYDSGPLTEERISPLVAITRTQGGSLRQTDAGVFVLPDNAAPNPFSWEYGLFAQYKAPYNPRLHPQRAQRIFQQMFREPVALETQEGRSALFYNPTDDFGMAQLRQRYPELNGEQPSPTRAWVYVDKLPF